MTVESQARRPERLSPDQVQEIRSRAREAAGQVLDYYWDLNKYPVDPVKIARDYGAEVFQVDLKDDLDGLFVPAQSGNLPQIYVDTDTSFPRRRFSIAHELGHLVEDGDKAQVDRRRDAIARQGTDPHEVFANEFAASLLMPDFAIKKLLKAGMGKMSLHQFFQVSPIAMQNRLKNLGIA